MRVILTFLSFILCIVLIANGTDEIDSLLNEHKSAVDLALKSELERQIGIKYLTKKKDIETAKLYMELALDHALKQDKVDSVKIKAYTFKAYYYATIKKDLVRAIDYYQLAVPIAKKSKQNNHIQLEADLYSNIAIIYKRLKADESKKKQIEYTYKALLLHKQINNRWQIVKFNYALGLIYMQADYFEKSKEHFREAIEHAHLTNNKRYDEEIYANLGYIYYRQGSLDKSITNCKRAIKISKNKKKKAGALNTLGLVYLYHGIIQKESQRDIKLDSLALAESTFIQALKVSQEINNNTFIAENLIGLSSIDIENKKYSSALQKIEPLIDKKEIRNESIINAKLYSNLAFIYMATGNRGKGLKSLEEKKHWDDVSNAKKNESFEKGLGYVTDDLKRKEKAEREELRKEADKEIREQEQLTQAGIIFAVLLVIIAIILTYNFIKERKTKILVQGLNSDLTSKNKNILDSINYAEKIQKAILPPKEMLEDMLGDTFLYFKPKDIVSGDFYWLRVWKDSIVVCVADCTGHGVPGAFMSMLGFESLNQALHDLEDNVSPSKLLDQLNINIKLALSSYSDAEAIKDGMDVSLVQYFPEKKKLLFAGAGNPCYIIRDKKLHEIKGDIFPIGHYHERTDAMKFNEVEYELKTNDSIYIFSDGYPDQFGGPRGKKLKYRAFKSLLTKLSNEKMEHQSEMISKHMDDWRGNEEQIDDMCIIAFKAK